MPFTTMEELNLGNHRGLSEEEAAARLRESGYNEIPAAKKRSIFAIALEVLRQPMFLMLVGGGAIYLILGDVHEALMLLGFVFVVMGITFYQERKMERALEALRDLSSPRALVIRDGELKRIPGREVVVRRPPGPGGRRPGPGRCRGFVLLQPVGGRIALNR